MNILMTTNDHRPIGSGLMQIAINLLLIRYMPYTWRLGYTCFNDRSNDMLCTSQATAIALPSHP